MSLYPSRTKHDESFKDEFCVPIGWLKKSILRYKLKYFGHLKRNDSLGKIITEEKMKDKKATERERSQ